jgi:hypothetical protein
MLKVEGPKKLERRLQLVIHLFQDTISISRRADVMQYMVNFETLVP